MKKLLKTLAFLAVAAIAGTASAQNAWWIGQSYLIAAPNGESLAWFDASGGGQPNSFNGYDFGEVSSLQLAGQVKTSQDDAAVYPAQIGYRFDGDDSTVVYTDLAWIGWNGNNNVFGFEPGDTSGWAYPNPDYPGADSQVMDIDFSRLAPGEHTINVWFRAPKNGYGEFIWDSNSDQNYNATFTVPTPEFQTVTFDPGEYGTCDTQSMVFEYDGTYHDLPRCNSDGAHARIAWYTAPDGEGGEPVYDGDEISGPAALTLYAHWTTEQTLTFDPQSDEAAWTEVYTVGTQYGPLPKPTWENHVFLGWFTEAEGGNQFSRFSRVITRPVRTMYAHWLNEQTVTFDPQSEDAPWTEVYTMGTQFGPLPKPTWENHVFLGWFTEAEGGRQFSRFSKVTTAQTRTMYAHWLNEQTVTFDPQNGDASWTEVYTMGGQFGTLPKPTWAGHDFMGWFTESEGGRQFSRFSKVTTSPTRTMYAQWQAKDTAPAAAALSLASRAKAGARSTTTVKDTITAALLAAGSTSYVDFSGLDKTSDGINSDAVYAGNTSKNSGNIQLNSSTPKGIVTTTSGGKAKKVTVVWGNTTVRTLQIYGKASAYTDGSDLYGSDAGTLIGGITNGSGTELTITDDYAYIGMRSADKALQLTSVAIDWEVDTPEPTEPTVTLEATATNVVVGTEVTITATATNFSGDVGWSWTVNGDSAVGTTSSFTLTPASAGDYAVQATATSGAQSTNATVTITATAPVVKYDIAIATGIVNGSVETDPADEAAAGDTVTVIPTADPGYKLDSITVNDEALAAGVTTFTMPATNVTVSATFVEKTGGTVTYTVTSKTAVSATGDVPDGSSAAYSQTYGTAKQATKDNSFTLTLSGYEGLKIVGLTLSMHSNGSTGAGTLSVTCGDATIASIANAGFGDGIWNDTYTTTYTDVTPAVTATVVDDNDVVIEIAATTNSLYCESYTIEYEFVPTVFSITLDPATDFDVAYNAYATITATPHNAAAGDVTYGWTIDDVPVAGVTGNVLVLNTTAPEVYTAVCTAEDASGAVATASVSYMVNEPASPSVSLVASAESVRIGDAVTITATASDFSGEVEEWVWVGDGSAVDSGNTSVFTVDTSTAGDHVVMVEATYGTESADAEITIAVEGPHDIEVFAGDHGLASAPDTAYAGETVTVTVTPDDGYTLDTIVVNDGDVAVTGTSFVMPDDDALVEVTFTEIPETVEFVRVTSVDDLTAGEYVITGVKNAGNNEEYAMKAEVSTTSTKYLLRRTSAVTIQTDAETGAVSVTDASDDIIWTLAKDDDDQWTIYNSATGYVYLASSANTANIEANQDENNKCLWTISSNSDGDGMFAVANVAYDTRQLRYNTTSGQERFACYAPGNSGTRTGSGLNFYKKKEAVPMQTVTFNPGEYGTCDTEYMVFEFGGTYHDLPRCNSDGAHARIAWYTAPDGEGGDPVFDGDDVSGPEELTLYAHWTTEQTLTFDPQSDEEPWTEVFTVGTQYGPLPKPTWANHVFLGWFTEAEGGSQFSRFSRVITRPERTMYAHWLSEQTVTFDPQSDEEPWTETYEMGTQFGPLPKPKWANHVFLGWFTEPEGGSQFSRFSRVTAKAARTMYAHWLSEQTVTFEPQNGQDSWTETYEMGTQFGPLPKPTWAGYKFLGWFTEPEGGSQFSRFSKVTTSPTRTMYAQWQEKASALSITAFAMTPRAVATAARSAASGTVECTLWFETVADVAYEIQWTASLDSDWVVLKGWIGEVTGETAVTVDVPAGPAGFFRLVEAAD